MKSYREWCLKASIVSAICFLVANDLCAQVETVSAEKVKVGSLIQRKFILDNDLKHDFRLVPPKIEPAGSCYTDFRVNPQQPNELVLSIVPLRSGKIRVYGFGVHKNYQQTNYLSPVMIDAQKWPVEPSFKAVRGGVGALKVTLLADPTQTTAGERLQLHLRAEGSAAMAVMNEPEIKLRHPAEASTETTTLKPLKSDESWEGLSRDWFYEWTPSLAGEYRADAVLFTYLSTDQYLKTILTSRPLIQVGPRPQFEITELPVKRDVKKRETFSYKEILSFIGAGAVILLTLRRTLIRAWIRYWLYVASRPDTTFETTLKIYRRFFNQINLQHKNLRRPEQDLLEQVEKKLLGPRQLI